MRQRLYHRVDVIGIAPEVVESHVSGEVPPAEEIPRELDVGVEDRHLGGREHRVQRASYVQQGKRIAVVGIGGVIVSVILAIPTAAAAAAAAAIYDDLVILR